MKLKCTQIFDNQDNEQSKSPWLTIGSTYIVLEVLGDIKKGISYRLIGDSDKSPGIFKATQFEIINNNQPSNWFVNIAETGFIVIGPRLWRKPGFWEDCYEGDPAALEIYNHEARIIYEEEGIL